MSAEELIGRLDALWLEMNDAILSLIQSERGDG
jgi:hypothetical protein